MNWLQKLMQSNTGSNCQPRDEEVGISGFGPHAKHLPLFISASVSVTQFIWVFKIKKMNEFPFSI